MRPFFFILLLSLAACGVKHSTVEYGTTTKSDLIEIKGEPLKVEELPIQSNSMLIYQQNQKYQLKGEVVVTSFSDPSPDERALIFWKHKFKDCDTRVKKISETVDAHTPSEYELSCPAMGKSVIYTAGSPFVTRVLEYAK